MNDEKEKDNSSSDFWKLLGAGAVGAVIGAAGTLLADAILSDLTPSHYDEDEDDEEDEEEEAQEEGESVTVTDRIPPEAHSSDTCQSNNP